MVVRGQERRTRLRTSYRSRTPHLQHNILLSTARTNRLHMSTQSVYLKSGARSPKFLNSSGVYLIPFSPASLMSRSRFLLIRQYVSVTIGVRMRPMHMNSSSKPSIDHRQSAM